MGENRKLNPSMEAVTVTQAAARMLIAAFDSSISGKECFILEILPRTG